MDFRYTADESASRSSADSMFQARAPAWLPDLHCSTNVAHSPSLLFRRETPVSFSPLAKICHARLRSSSSSMGRPWLALMTSPRIVGSASGKILSASLSRSLMLRDRL